MHKVRTSSSYQIQMRLEVGFALEERVKWWEEEEETFFSPNLAAFYSKSTPLLSCDGHMRITKPNSINSRGSVEYNKCLSCLVILFVLVCFVVSAMLHNHCFIFASIVFTSLNFDLKM